MKITIVAFILCSCAVSLAAYATESTPAINQALPSRKPANLSDVDPVYDEPGMRGNSAHRGPYTPNKDGYDGARVQFYYDPMSSYSKIITNNSTYAGNFGYSSVTGAQGGVQAMWSVWAPSDLEFQTGLDYIFPIDVQGQQTAVINPSVIVNSQSLNIAGFKALQMNYRINLADFTTAFYGGVGVYYGTNQATLQYYASGTTTNNLVKYSKLMMVYTAGARLDYNFNRSRTIAAGIGAEFFVPTKLADQISQSGSYAPFGGTSSEMTGQSSQLQSNLDFWTGIGCRLMAGVAAYF